MDSVQLSVSSADGNLLNINERTVSQAMNSYLCSTKYLRHVVPLTMFYIVYNRIDYDSDNYVETNIKDWKYVILNKNSKNESLNSLYKWAYGAMEALEKGCLSQLFLKILNNNETVEYYQYTFQYCKNPITTTRPKGTSNEVIKITRDWFQKISTLREFDKIPSTAALSVEVVLTDKPTSLKLLHYTPTEKSDVYDPKEKENVKNLLHLGGINTNYHKVRAYCKIKSIESTGIASTIGGNELVEIIEDEPFDNLINIGVYDNDNNFDVCDDVILKKTRQTLTGGSNEENESINKRKLTQVSMRISPTTSANSIERSTTKSLAQKIIGCKDIFATKEIDTRITIFGDTTIEAVEQENSILPVKVPPRSDLNIQDSQGEKHAESIKTLKSKLKAESNDTNTFLIKKFQIKERDTKKHGFDEMEQPHLQSKAIISEKSPNISKELLPTHKSKVPIILDGKQMKKAKGKFAIIGDVIIEPEESISLQEKSEHDSEALTTHSELYINGELVDKAKRKKTKNAKSDQTMAKKLKRNSEEDSREKSSKKQEMFSKDTSSGQVPRKLSTIQTNLKQKKKSDSIFDDTTIELEQQIACPSDLFEGNVNKCNKENHQGLYINNIHSLTPKKPAAKQRPTYKKNNKANVKDTQMLHTNEKYGESSSKLPKTTSTQSYDSTILGDNSKKNSAASIQDSLQFESSVFYKNSSELLPQLDVAGLTNYGGKQRTDCEGCAQSISSTESDNRYINNRIKFG